MPNKRPIINTRIFFMDIQRMLTGLADALYPSAGEFMHLIVEKIEDYRSMRICLTEIVVVTLKRAYL